MEKLDKDGLRLKRRERRLKILPIATEDMVEMLSVFLRGCPDEVMDCLKKRWEKPQAVSEIPADCEVAWVSAPSEFAGFLVALWHESFDEIPYNAYVPWLEPL